MLFHKKYRWLLIHSALYTLYLHFQMACETVLWSGDVLWDPEEIVGKWGAFFSHLLDGFAFQKTLVQSIRGVGKQDVPLQLD